MKKYITSFIYLLLTTTYIYSQVGNNITFEKQKQAIDSLILKDQKSNYQKHSIIGVDSIMGSYKGFSLVDQSNNIRRIDIEPDSSSVKITLFYLREKIIAIQEDDKLSYRMNEAYYNTEGNKEISQQVLAKFKLYDDIAKSIKLIFNPASPN